MNCLGYVLTCNCSLVEGSLCILYTLSIYYIPALLGKDMRAKFNIHMASGLYAHCSHRRMPAGRSLAANKHHLFCCSPYVKLLTLPHKALRNPAWGNHLPVSVAAMVPPWHQLRTSTQPLPVPSSAPIRLKPGEEKKFYKIDMFSYM